MQGHEVDVCGNERAARQDMNEQDREAFADGTVRWKNCPTYQKCRKHGDDQSDENREEILKSSNRDIHSRRIQLGSFEASTKSMDYSS